MSDDPRKAIADVMDAVSTAGDVVGTALDGWGSVVVRGIAAAVGLVGALIRAGVDDPITITRIRDALVERAKVDGDVDAELRKMGVL